MINRIKLAWYELRLLTFGPSGRKGFGLTGVDILEWKAACCRGAETAKAMRHDPKYHARKAEALRRDRSLTRMLQEQRWA